MLDIFRFQKRKVENILDIDGIKVEVPYHVMLNKKAYNIYCKEICSIVMAIKEEAIFLYSGVQLLFHLDKIESAAGKIFVQFHIITFCDTVKQLLNEMIFDAELLCSNIKMKCYYTNLECISVDDGTFKVSLLGEVID